jgi:hypothetical protein
MLEGFLRFTKDGKSMVGGVQEGEEACNCKEKVFAHVDYHIWLVKDPKDPLDKAIVVESSPRMREIQKRRWIKQDTLESDLNFLASQKVPVRVYGWLMFDGEHANQLPRPGKDPKKIRRGTLWEIHPITRIESFQPGRGCKLDWCEM